MPDLPRLCLAMDSDAVHVAPSLPAPCTPPKPSRKRRIRAAALKHTLWKKTRWTTLAEEEEKEADVVFEKTYSPDQVPRFGVDEVSDMHVTDPLGDLVEASEELHAASSLRADAPPFVPQVSMGSHAQTSDTLVVSAMLWRRLVLKSLCCSHSRVFGLLSMQCFKLWKLYTVTDDRTDKGDAEIDFDRCLICGDVIVSPRWSFARDYEAEDLLGTFGIEFSEVQIEGGWLCGRCGDVIDPDISVEGSGSDADGVSSNSTMGRNTLPEVAPVIMCPSFSCSKCGIAGCKGGLWCKG